MDKNSQGVRSMYCSLLHAPRAPEAGKPRAKVAFLAAALGWIWMLSLSGCWTSPINLAGRPCPCAESEGWVCDEQTSSCVRREALQIDDAGGGKGGPDGGGGGNNGGGNSSNQAEASVDAQTPKLDGGGARDAGKADAGKADAGKADAGKPTCTGKPAVLENNTRIYAADYATDYRCSPNGQYRFGFADTGDLQLTHGTQVLWSWARGTHSVNRVTMQTDSNLVIKDVGNLPIFGTCTERSGIPDARLVVKDDGNFEIVAPDGTVLLSVPSMRICPPL